MSLHSGSWGFLLGAAIELEMSVVRSDIFCCSMQGHMSQDFLTADFYIDESMPSSYSDSNGVAVLASSGQPLVPSQSDALTSELQRQLDEKSASLLVMQKNLDQERAELCEFRRSLSCLHKAAAAIRDSCHSDAASLRQDLSAARLMLAEHASQVNSAVEDALQALLARAERDQVGSIAALLLEKKCLVENCYGVEPLNAITGLCTSQ